MITMQESLFLGRKIGCSDLTLKCRQTFYFKAFQVKKRIAAFVETAILFWRTGWDSTCSAEQARSRLWSAPGTPFTPAPVRILILLPKNRSPPGWAVTCFLANNPDFDTVTPSQKSGVSLMPKWGQVDRTWGQIVDYVNPVGPKEIPQALVLRVSYFLLA